VRQTESLVRSYTQAKKAPVNKEKSSDIQSLEDSLAEKLGTRVTVEDKNGQGKLVIEYKSLDILDGILEHIK
jgi:ParB family chromosome partitioning protein